MVGKLTYPALASILLIAVLAAVPAYAAVHHQQQDYPIRLGTSGGNIYDSSNYFCCGGTLGALVEDDDAQYILSNNHVLARTNSALPDEKIIHPGLIDQRPVCYEDIDDTVAELSDFVEIKFKRGRAGPSNKVDAAIAQVVPGAVEPNGAILGIGLLSTETVKAVPGLKVKKSGRTTGITTGTVTAVKVTVDVGYWQQCGTGPITFARFKDQILIESSRFAAGGDSGSLVVEDINSRPRAVGLLFAGSPNGRIAVANPIKSVLKAFNVTMVGAEPVADLDPKPHKGRGKGPSNSPFEQAVAAKDLHEDKILNIDGVAGIGVAIAGEKGPVIRVYLEQDSDDAREQIPETLDNTPVEIIVTGPFEAF